MVKVANILFILTSFIGLALMHLEEPAVWGLSFWQYMALMAALLVVCGVSFVKSDYCDK